MKTAKPALEVALEHAGYGTSTEAGQNQ